MARTRRRFTQEHLAGLVGISRETLGRLEQGDPGVSLAVLAGVLWALQLDHELEQVARPDKDVLGMSLEQGRQVQRVHMKDEDHDF